MKKIYLALSLFAGLALTSCNLDESPSTAMPLDEGITSEKDLESAVKGVGYLLTEDRMLYASEYGLYADFLTNDFAVIDDNGQSSAISRYTLTQNDALPENAYCYMYKALANANLALKYSETLPADSTVSELRGQLYAWRGLLHFDLARMFAHIPTSVDDVNAKASGIVVTTQVQPVDFKGTRSTLKETYDQIIADYSEALKLMDKGSKKKNGFFNYYAALALRARAYLYMGENEKALADAKEVIADGGYELYTIKDYASVWDKEATSESIFELLITSNHNPQRNSIGYYTDASGYAECGFNTEGKLYKYLTENSNDVRSKLIKVGKVNKNAADSYYPAKYPGREGIYVNNPKIIRLSEVYLIAAEASVKLGNAEEAASYINAIERNRVADYQDVASVTIDDVVFEYEKELFAENQIAFAYWRNRMSVTNQVNKVINYDDNRTILPIPQREIDYNPALEQNPGYGM
ncbi:MAG: RagB/SusD family nutrient uptake outer membrane protein [Bacteroidaceae bacterium]|nr:RagB/SusD family nutrient uptake outer membrane protein [Bacteroidaceae bacterium]